jgi:CheY-like chemotaxis protein
MSQGQATHRNLRELPLAGKTVLVLEDELPIALSIESDLRDAGAAVVELVRSTIEARRTIRGSAAFDAAVVDLHLVDRI